MTEATYCTNTDCYKPSGLYLCATCMIELDDLLKQVPNLIAALDPALLATKVTKPVGSTGHSANKAGSQAPMDVDADLLRDLLKTLAGHRAYDLANHYPTAGQYLHMARIWVDKANTITHGPVEVEIDHAANAERVKEIAPPMPTRQLLPWLREHSKIHINGMDIRNWVRRGKLTAVQEKPTPTYKPHEVIKAWHDTRT